MSVDPSFSRIVTVSRPALAPFSATLSLQQTESKTCRGFELLLHSRFLHCRAPVRWPNRRLGEPWTPRDTTLRQARFYTRFAPTDNQTKTASCASCAN